MELVINFDKIKDPSKREWLINTLKLMNIRFHTTEKPQSMVEYNTDLDKGDNEIESGEFTTIADLKSDVSKW